MNMKTICKDTGHFFVGSSAWLAEKAVSGTVTAAKVTAKGTMLAAKAAAAATRKMTQKGEQIANEHKARREERKAAEAAVMETQDRELATDGEVSSRNEEILEK